MNDTIQVDVRQDIRLGREPFSKIMQAVAALSPDQRMLLIAPFEPVPLLQLLAKQGFQHTARANAAGDWEVLFTPQNRNSGTPGMASDHSTQPARPATSAKAAEVIEVDARGLEPPLPMVKILEALSSLPAGAELHARTDRRPIHLYPQLEERGFGAQTEQQSDGTFLTHIRPR